MTETNIFIVLKRIIDCVFTETGASYKYLRSNSPQTAAGRVAAGSLCEKEPLSVWQKYKQSMLCCQRMKLIFNLITGLQVSTPRVIVFTAYLEHILNTVLSWVYMRVVA